MGPAVEDHDLELYEDEEALCGAAAEYLGAGLVAREGALIVARPEHRDGICAQLRASGFDVDGGVRSGRIGVVDARELLGQIAIEGMPDGERFQAVLAPMLRRCADASGARRVRVYGEMVDLLWGEGRHDAAAHLEDLWNALAAEQPFALLCAYRSTYLKRPGDAEQLSVHRVYRAHGHVSPAVPAERYFRLLVESVKDYAIFMLDPRGRVISWNPGAERLKGYRADEILGQHFSRFYPPEEADKCDDELVVALRDGRIELEGWRRRKDGSSFWADVVITAVHDDDGRHIGFAKVTRDLTERRQAEIDERYRVLVETAKDAIISIEADRTITSWNAAAERIFGWDAKDIIGRPLACIIPDTPDPARLVGHTVELPGMRGDGAPLAVEVSLSALAAAPIAYTVILRDITDRKLADEQQRFLLAAFEELSSSRDYHATLAAVARALVPRLADGCAIDLVDGDRLERCAAAGIDLAGAGAGHLLSVPMVGGRQTRVGVLSLVTAPSGRAYTERDRLFASTLAERAAAAVENARLFREIEVALARETAARLSAEDNVRFSEMFAAVLGHDLRNPLSAIFTGAQLLLRLAVDERQRRPAGRIITSAERMARMIDQLLDFTRIRLGAGLKIEPAAANLGELARQLVEETEAALGTRIVFTRSGDTIGVWDADRLAQVLSNLLANAVQHGAGDRPATIHVDGRDPAGVVVDVWNRGRIPEDILPQIFEPFRGSRYQREQARGLGLGLYIAHEIVRAHGGAVTVDSTEAEGTTFRVGLPRRAGA
jgi:PAS domain S-box-containing protein